MKLYEILTSGSGGDVVLRSGLTHDLTSIRSWPAPGVQCWSN